MRKLQVWFNSLDSKLQILAYNILSQLTVYITDWLATGEVFSWRTVALIIIGGFLNVLAYLRANIKE